MMVKCQDCGNVYASPPRWAGDRCLVGGCYGQLENYVRPHFVQCSHCGNVFGCPPHNEGDMCHMPHCAGTLRLPR